MDEERGHEQRRRDREVYGEREETGEQRAERLRLANAGPADQPPYEGPREPVAFEGLRWDMRVLLRGRPGVFVVKTCYYPEVIVVERADGAGVMFGVEMADVLGRALP